jgi:hypothetical protein
VTRMLALLSTLTLAGCSWQGSLFGGRPAIIQVPPGEKVIEEPNGAVIAEPVASPIETTITGMSQAQTLRMLTRQLAR